MAKYVKTEEGYQEIETVNSNKMDKDNPVGTGSFSMGRKAGSVIGADSHTEGNITTASGNCSHAEGGYTIASGGYSHAEGKYNIKDTANKYAHIVGNGSSDTSRSNAHTLDWNGVGWFKDSVKVGGSSQDDSVAKTLATTEYVDTTVSTKISGKQDTLIQSGATVGQIAKITAVDSSGKPTAWEAVDMPSGGSGGGSEDMRVIKTITITSADVNSIYFNSDDNGLPFALTKHIRIRMYGAATNTGSTQAALFFRAGQTTGDRSQAEYPIKVNSNNVNYVFDFVWDLYSTINCWYGDFAHARAGAANLFRYVPNEDNNSSDITVREIKLVWSNASVFFQQGATIVVEGI